MANATVRDDLHPPCYAKNFATATAAVLHLDVTSGGAAPPGINHLPCGVIADASAVFTWKDATGTTINTTLAAGIFTRIAPKEITSASVAIVTIFWNPEP
jgi:hypothetical protein